jgi:hypothetical protein
MSISKDYQKRPYFLEPTLGDLKLTTVPRPTTVRVIGEVTTKIIKRDHGRNNGKGNNEQSVSGGKKLSIGILY